MMMPILRWIVYLLTLAGLCAFAVNYTAWFSSFLFYCVLALPLFSFVLSLWPYFALHLSFTAPLQVHRGEDAELKITASAKNCPYFLPVSLTVQQYDPALADPDHFPPKKAARFQFAPYPVFLRTGSPKTSGLRASGGIRITLPTEHTSVIRTEIRSAYMWDFLGLIRLPLRLSRRGEKTSARAADITVLPNPVPPPGKLRMWDNSQSATIPTQRFSEQYEIRDYRPGDALRAVHWKLSAKIDDLLVRESVEARCHVLAITVERVPDPDENDRLYDALDWMLRALCVRDHVQSVVVGWLSADGRCCTETLYDLDRLDDFYRRMLSDAIPDETPPHAFAAVYKSVDRGYHLDGDACHATACPVTVTTAGNTPLAAQADPMLSDS